MNGPVHLNGGTPLSPSGNDQAYLEPLGERAFRARCEARWMLWQSGDMDWQATGFPAELEPYDDWNDIFEELPPNVIQIAIGPVEQLDNLLSHSGPEAVAQYPSIKALLLDLSDDEFKSLALDLHADRLDRDPWSEDEIKELARIRRRGQQHG